MKGFDIKPFKHVILDA